MKVGIAGARGYSGVELQSYLKQCPQFEIVFRGGREGVTDEQFQAADLVFLCTPNEISMALAPRALSQGCDVIDLSGAFRLRAEDYPEWYGFEHDEAELLDKAFYALQPWVRGHNDWPKRAESPALVSNPGCYASAVELLLLPLLKEKIIDSQRISIDAKSGTSGAGKKADSSLLFTEIFGDFKPYKVGKHQHWPEIVQSARDFGGAVIEPAFVTELLPVERGISVCSFLEWAESVPKEERTEDRLMAAYKKYYEAFPDILLEGSSGNLSLKEVQRTNRIKIVPTVSFGKPLVFSMIDNLGRGAAGQALMNAFELYGMEIPEVLL